MLVGRNCAKAQNKISQNMKILWEKMVHYNSPWVILGPLCNFFFSFFFGGGEGHKLLLFPVWIEIVERPRLAWP